MAAFDLDTQSCPFQHAYRNGQAFPRVCGVVGNVSECLLRVQALH